MTLATHKKVPLRHFDDRMKNYPEFVYIYRKCTNKCNISKQTTT